MDGDVVRLGVAAIIGGTICISFISMAAARIFSRRRRDLPDSGLARIEARLERMEQAIDAMASEVERVSEGQQFTSRLLKDRQLERQS